VIDLHCHVLPGIDDGPKTIAGSLALLGGFLSWESRIANPIMPLRVLRQRMLMGSSLVRGLLITGMFSAFFLGALYLERVLGYDAIDTGLAFLPLTICIAVMSMGISARAAARTPPSISTSTKRIWSAGSELGQSG